MNPQTSKRILKRAKFSWAEGKCNLHGRQNGSVYVLLLVSFISYDRAIGRTAIGIIS
jgi:hypothetical protein